MGSNESPLSIGMLMANAHVCSGWEEKIDFSLSFLCATACLLILRYEREKNVPARQIKYEINERSEDRKREKEKKKSRLRKNLKPRNYTYLLRCETQQSNFKSQARTHA